MTRHLTIAAAALLAAIASTTPAAAERLVTSISRHQVMVNSNFTGTSIVLFGTVEPDTPASRRRAAGYDVVVTVTGPRQTIVERRKERVLGIWTNIGSRTFLNVPSYLAVLSNQPFEQITNPETMRQLQLGLADKVFPQELGNDIGDVARDDPFRSQFPPAEDAASALRPEDERRDAAHADGVSRGNSVARRSSDRKLRRRCQSAGR